MARGPHTSASSHTKAQPASITLSPLGKKGKPPEGVSFPEGWLPYAGALGGAPGRAHAGDVQARRPWNTLQGRDWRGPRAVLPACQPPFAAQTLGLTLHPPPHAVPPGPCWGLAILRALRPTPVRGRQRETHSSLCHFPSWAAKGLRLQPPAPSLQLACVYSHFLRPSSPQNLHPPAPLMLCRWERSGCWPQRFPALDFLQPSQAGTTERGASTKCRHPWPPT